MGQTIVVNPVTRIEGHAKHHPRRWTSPVRWNPGHLQVLEIRGFEKLLQGTELFKMPQITARLCGVCPAAHHLVAVTAIENGLGITAAAGRPSPPRAALRRSHPPLPRAVELRAHRAGHPARHRCRSGDDVTSSPCCDLDAGAGQEAPAGAQHRPAGGRDRGRPRRPPGGGGAGRHVRPAGAEKLGLIAGWGREAMELLEEVPGCWPRSSAPLAEALAGADDVAIPLPRPVRRRPGGLPQRQRGWCSIPMASRSGASPAATTATTWSST